MPRLVFCQYVLKPLTEFEVIGFIVLNIAYVCLKLQCALFSRV